METPSVPSWLHEHVEDALWKNNNCVQTNRICKIVDKAYQEGYMDGYRDGHADDDSGRDDRVRATTS